MPGTQSENRQTGNRRKINENIPGVFKARLDLEPDLVKGILSLGKEVRMRCLMDSFQLKMFYDSVKLFNTS